MNLKRENASEAFEAWWYDYRIKNGLGDHTAKAQVALDAFSAGAKAERGSRASVPEVGATARLRTIEGRLNGIANAMASCPGFAPIPQQLTYWRETVEQCYDLARDAGSPQDAS